MEMVIHLDEDVFEVVKNGTKNVESRVNDEKRRTLKVGDTLRFLKRPLEQEYLLCKVVGLDYYDNFSELVKHYEIKNLYLENYTVQEYLQLLGKFYSEEEQEKYGVVAIRFEIISK